MSNSEIDISKLSLEQLQGLLKQTETVSRRACRGVPRRPPAGSALGDTEGSEARAYASCLPRAPQETKNLALSLNSLKVAQARFTESANSLAALPADGEGACAARRRAPPPPRHAPRAPLPPAPRAR